MRELILDRSHQSGTDLDRDIVAYAEYVYWYRLEEEIPMDDSEGWQYAADDALMWMGTVEEENGKYFEIEDNSLFLVTKEDDEEDNND